MAHLKKIVSPLGLKMPPPPPGEVGALAALWSKKREVTCRSHHVYLIGPVFIISEIILTVY